MEENKRAAQGKPYAGNPHVWFEEGAGTPVHTRCSALLYNGEVVVHKTIENLGLKSFVRRFVLSVGCLICVAFTQACLNGSRDKDSKSLLANRLADVDGFPVLKWPSMMRSLCLKCEGVMYVKDSAGSICKDMLVARALYTDDAGLCLFVFSLYRKENDEWMECGDGELTLQLKTTECIVVNKSASDGVSVRVVNCNGEMKRSSVLVEFDSYLCVFHLLPLSET